MRDEPQPLERGQGLPAQACWNAPSSVGFVHTRANQYEAELTIEPVDGAWKLTGLTILQEERL